MADHPTSAELLLAREEPSQPESRRILEHVATCAACSLMEGALDSTERNLAEYWRARAEQLPAPPAVENLQTRLQIETAPRAFPMKRKIAVAVGLAACLVLALYLRNPLQPESVEAAEVLRHATQYVRTADASSRPRAFEIRSGRHVLRMSDAADPQLAKSLELAYVSWRDPLNPDDFSRWRDAHADRTDRVTRASGWVRLTTTVLGEGPVRSASITVSQPDWRPVARTIEFRDRESIEVREVTGAAPAIESKSTQPTDAPVEQPAAGAESDDLEVRLWEALRRADADVLDGASVRRDAAGVCYQVWPDEARRDLVSRALGAVSGARACSGAAGSRREARVLPPLSADAGVQAPFTDALTKHFGSRETATQYVDRVLRQHVELLARVSALERFLLWFTPARFDALPKDQQRRIRAIAAEHAGAIRTSGASYLDLVAKGLRAVAPVSGSAPQPESASCNATARTATSLAGDLKALQAGFNGLFGGAEIEGPNTSREELLRTTVEHHAALGNRLGALCVASE